MKLATRFGEFGGLFVPEILTPALEELEAAFVASGSDPSFQAELDELLTSFAGRPTPVYRCRRFGAETGASIWLKREDLLHGGAHKTNQALGQGLLARRMGKRRLIAETGAGQHGVATALTGAALGLETVVYMGARDVDRQRPNVDRMRLFGARVVPVSTGSATLKDAINEALRDWSASYETTHYLLGTVAGPHPFPTMVRDFQRVIGDEARRQFLDATGTLPEAVVASVGGGSNAIGIFTAFLRDEAVELVGVEAAGRGLDTDAHGATLLRGSPGILHGAYTMVLQDGEGQILESHSVSAGLDYPAVGTRACPPPNDRTGPLRRLHRHPGARDPGGLHSRRGHPAGAGIGPRARGGARPRTGRPSPGAGEPERPGRQGSGDGGPLARGGAMSDRYARLFQRLAADGEGAFIPFVTLGDPDPAAGADILTALVASGADALELGFPFSDPVADGPVIQAAATRALAAGTRAADCWRRIREVRESAPAIPVGLLVYANLVVRPGPDRFYASAREAGVDSVLIADLPLAEAEPFERAARRAGVAPVFVAPPNAPPKRLAEIARRSRGYVYVTRRAGVTGDPGRAAADLRERMAALRRLGAAPPVVGFGVSRPADVRQVLEAGAAGAIVGSALVRCLGTPTGPGAGLPALRALAADLKAATRAAQSPI